MNNTAGCLPALTAMRLKPKRKSRISLNLLHSYEQYRIAYIKIVNRISSSKIRVIFENHTHFWHMFHIGVKDYKIGINWVCFYNKLYSQCVFNRKVSDIMSPKIYTLHS